jgi:hypothetical protein
VATEGDVVRPVIKALVPLWDHHPSSPYSDPPDLAHFGVRIVLLIGTEGEIFSDSFDCFVCSPSWLADRIHDRDFGFGLSLTEPIKGTLGLGLVIMSEWSLAELRGSIESICDTCTAADWDTAASRVGRYFPWEHSYRYDQYVDKHPERFRIPSPSKDLAEDG